MQALEALHKKIRTAQELLGVVKTMKTLAAVSIRQYEHAVESIEEYRRVVEAGWLALLRHGGGRVREPSSREAVCMVIASDQGMCGQFNEAVLNHAMAQITHIEKEGGLAAFWVYGEKLRGAFDNAGHRTVEYFDVPGTLPGVIAQVQEAVQRIEAARSDLGVERFYVCHNMLSEHGAYRQICSRILPLDEVWVQAYARKRWPGRCLPMIGLSREIMFVHLFRHYIFISLYRAFAQSMAGENAARLMAMQAAEKNILEVVEALQADFRELRQATVTAELLDIVSGFEALSGSPWAL